MVLGMVPVGGRREGGRWGLPENVKEVRAVVEEGTEREVTAKEGRAVIDCGAGEVLTSRADRSASSAVLFSLLSRDRPPVAPALTDTESVRAGKAPRELRDRGAAESEGGGGRQGGM